MRSNTAGSRGEMLVENACRGSFAIMVTGANVVIVFCADSVML